MSLDPRALSGAALDFLTERHLATLTTLRPDGTAHVVPVGFTWEADRAVARVITGGGSRKARNLGTGGRATLCQFKGWKWLSLEGMGRVLSDPDAVHDAERRYAARYREPSPNPRRVVLEISVYRMLGLVDRPGAAAPGRPGAPPNDRERAGG